MTPNRPFKKALAANANTSSFASKVPTITEPTNDGVVTFADWGIGGMVPACVKVLPYGLGSDNDVYDLRVYAWRRIGSGPAPGILWVPTLYGIFTCTLSAATGVAGSPVLATERFADTIALKTDTLVSQPSLRGTDGANALNLGEVSIFSPGSDLIGWFSLKLRGAEKIEFTFDQTTGTPTGNCLITFE